MWRRSCRRVKLRHTKTNFGERAVPFGLELRFTEEQVTVEPYVIDAGGLAEEHAMTVREKALLWLVAGPAFPKEISDAVHAEYGSVKKRGFTTQARGAGRGHGRARRSGAAGTAYGERAARCGRRQGVTTLYRGP